VKQAEFDSYPQPAPKPKIDWQTVWDKFSYGLGNLFGIGSGIGVVLGIIGLIAFGITSCTSQSKAAEDWALECRQAGNQVIGMTSGVTYCMSETQVLPEPKTDTWGSFDTVACTAQGGYTGRNVNGNSYSYYCIKGKVISKSP